VSKVPRKTGILKWKAPERNECTPDEAFPCLTTGRELGGDWMCRVAYTKEELDRGNGPSKGIFK
jgi:hypothetical protein